MTFFVALASRPCICGSSRQGTGMMPMPRSDAISVLISGYYWPRLSGSAIAQATDTLHALRGTHQQPKVLFQLLPARCGLETPARSDPGIWRHCEWLDPGGATHPHGTRRQEVFALRADGVERSSDPAGPGSHRRRFQQLEAHQSALCLPELRCPIANIQESQ